MTWTLAIAAPVLLFAALVQSATGFGFSLLAGPALFALVDPVEAVGLIMVLGIGSNVLVLFTEKRELTIQRNAAVTAIAFAIPGLPLGAVAVEALSRRAMTIAVAVVVLVLVLDRLVPLTRRLVARRALAGFAATDGLGAALRRLRPAALAGFAIGVLTTSTTTSGPPLAIWLTGRGLRPAVIRDTVCAIYLVLGVIGLGVLVAVSGAADAFGAARWLPVLLPALVLGQVAGRHAFRLLSPGRYEQAVLTAATAAAVVGLARVLA